MSEVNEPLYNRLLSAAQAVVNDADEVRLPEEAWRALPGDTPVTLTKDNFVRLIDEMRSSVTLPLEVALMALAAASGRVADVADRMESLTTRLAEQEVRVNRLERDVAIRTLGGANG